MGKLLLLLAVVMVAATRSSNAALTATEFDSYLGEKCFRLKDDETQMVNGQENPLASTLENFISLAEKFEMSNPTKTLKEVLFYFIRNYTYNNIEYTILGDIGQWTPKDYVDQDIDTLWEPDEGQRMRVPDGVDPFTDGEKCSLFNIISYSVIRSARKFNVERAATNNTWKNGGRQFNPDPFYPLEQGVVSIRGSTYSTTLGRVLTGLYVGLNENRKRPMSDFPRIPSASILNEQSSVVDPLYTLTVSEVIALSTWRSEVGKREKMAKDGIWNSVPIGNDLDTDDICPMLYTLNEGSEQAFTYNALRGAADGLILGKIIGSIANTKRDVRLSQVLRMYYSKGGLSGQTQDIGQIWGSFCNRDSVLQSVEREIEEQLKLYLILGSKSWKESTISSSTTYGMTYYRQIKNEVFGNINTDASLREISEYCRNEISLERVENLPLESKLDIIVVTDSSYGRDFFERQQLVLGYLAKQLDLRQTGSQMTILTDQRLATAFTTEGSVLLKPIVEDTRSAACAACTVTQVAFESSSTVPEDEIIFALDQLLQKKKDNQTRLSGVSGKLVVYFNFQEEERTGRPTPIQSRTTQALHQLHTRHLDVRIYALGRNLDVLKQYARGDSSFVMNAMDASAKEVGYNLYRKIIMAPSTLQFNDCADGRGESSAVLEDFVTPNAVQHWEMPAKYFYKSFKPKFTFEASSGPIKVCRSRATLSPELVKETCEDIPQAGKSEFPLSNPCKGFSKESCAPFYFSIIGVNETDSSTTTRRDYCTDSINSENKCRTLDQIKFKVMHEGIRCSGCLNLIASALVVFIGITIARLF